MRSLSTEEARRLLARGSGRWRGTERFPPDGAPTGVPAVTRIDARVMSGGTLLVADHGQTVAAEEVMVGHSITAWTPSLNAVVMYFFDGSGEPPAVYRGGWNDEAALVLEGPGPEGSRIRHTSVFPDPRRMWVTSELSFDRGSNWLQAFDAEYVRED